MGNDIFSSMYPEDPEMDNEYAPAPITVALMLTIEAGPKLAASGLLFSANN